MRVKEIIVFEIIYFIGLIASLVILSSKKDFFKGRSVMGIIGFFNLRRKPVLGILCSFGWFVVYPIVLFVAMFKLFFLSLDKA